MVATQTNTYGPCGETGNRRCVHKYAPLNALPHRVLRLFCLPNGDRSRVFDHQRPAVRLSGLDLGVRGPTVWGYFSVSFGDTFLYQQNGIYFESRVSYYGALNGLDLTAGRTRFQPNRIDTALGRCLSPEEPPLSFGCHSTASSTENQVHPERLIPGATGVAC